jgi:UDP-N-acetylmuramoyl-L-alanyl-D-glutamate--2,6-diaminopimelate ligase
VGTVETRIGDVSLPSVRTTPEATDLQALFAVMRERGVQAVTMEVSSHALALRRVAGTHFDVAVFTNLSQDHLDFHGDLARYYAAKRELFTAAYAGTAVVNVDDAHGARLAGGDADVPVVTCSPSGADAAWRARALRSGPGGSRMDVSGPDGLEIELRTALPGDFNAENALLALAALVSAGVDPSTAAAGIAGAPSVPGRMERVDAGQPFTAVVDYAHTPQAVRVLLHALRPDPPARLLLVLGCGGDRDHAKRPLMGRAAAESADVVVVTDDNPRSEDAATIREAVLEGARQAGGHARVTEVGDRGQAITAAAAAAGPGDVVVVAGKGHEQGQEVNGVIRPFDDRAALRAALEKTA